MLHFSLLLAVKNIKGDVKFQTASSRGLGFKIIVLCDSCPPRTILSCPLIGNMYEIIRRFIFTMRVLGLGLRSVQKFCGLIYMSQFLFQNTYDIIGENTTTCIETLYKQLFKNAVKTEIQ